MRDIKSTVDKRKEFALECKELFQEYLEGFHYETPYSGAQCFQYWACSNVTLASLPRTLVSGPVADMDFWTDGAIMVRYNGKQRPTDAIVTFDKSVSSLLVPGIRVKNGFLTFHPHLQPSPYVLMVSERKWALFDVRYIDFAVKHGHPGEFYFNSAETGVLLKNEAGVHAYVSKVALAPQLSLKLTSMMERLYAICGNRPEFVEDRGLPAF